MTMKPKSKVTLALLLGMLLGWVLSFFVPNGCRSPGHRTDERDTIRTITVDTLTDRHPVAEATVPVDTQVFLLPVRHQGSDAGGLSHCTGQTDTTFQTEARVSPTYGTGAGGEPRPCLDSVAVEIPITQKHYRDSTYEAWVSGFAQNMDSIRVYPRTETITIRDYKPPNRWHLGLTAGYAYTPRGFQPYIGIGISYSLFSWK